MESIEALVAHIRSQGHFLDIDGHAYLEKLKVNFHVFVDGLQEEGKGTKAAFHVLVQSTFEGHHLSHEEKVQVENQLKDLLKTLDLVALTVLPGGTLFFILSAFLKLNKYIIPSAFLKENKAH